MPDIVKTLPQALDMARTTQLPPPEVSPSRVTALFSRIASTLGITERWVGEEPFSEVTALYNRILSEELPKAGIRCRIVPRKQAEGAAISASEVRRRIQSGDLESLSSLLPASTLRYFMSPEAAGVIEKIRAAEEVTHH